MSKLTWFVVVLAIVLVLYAIASGLYADVVSPFRPPNP